MQRVGLSPSISGCEGPEPWSQTACIQIQLPPLTACVTLGKLNNLSVLVCFICKIRVTLVPACQSDYGIK